MATNPHSILEREDYVLPHGATISCSVCHGDGTAHMDAGGGEGTIFNFTGEPAVRMEKCLSCHGSNPRFAASPHAQLGLACNSCHRIHSEHQSPPMLHPASGAASLTALDESSAMCAGCHGDVFTQFSYNERHRLAEGILQCSSCHDPHAPSQRTNLGGFKQEMCVSCHTDKGGPYVYEHGSVRVEGCVSCHEPHGTVARHQLRHQNVAELCYSCHAEVPSFHFSNTDPPRFDLTTQCTNCHSSIHGSNLDPFFLN
jgi:DmsE family decaheme c-type cytochrome